MQEEQCLKYGDNVILKSLIENKCFIIAQRKLSFIIQTSNEVSNKLNLYEHLKQMIFIIYPKLLYESQNKYFKEQNKSKKQEIQNQLLYNRMLAEKNYNEQLIQNMKSQKVLYGDYIMLFHPLSQQFFQKDSENDDRMLFQIIPDPIILDNKLGQQINIFDQFLLVQNQNLVYFDKLTPIIMMPKNITNTNNFDYEKEYITYPSIAENSQLFNLFEAKYAEHVSLSMQQQSIHTIQALILKSSQMTQVKYGDFVRIKLIQAQSQENDGYLNCSINTSGSYPQALIQINNLRSDQCNEKCGSIFQIISEDDCQLGQAIQMQIIGKSQTIGYQHIILRHYISGDYLVYDNKLKCLIMRQDLKNKISKLNSSEESQASPDQKKARNLPGIQIYNALNQTQRQSETLKTVQNQSLYQDIVNEKSIFEDYKFLLIQKIANGQSLGDEISLTYGQSFNIALKEGNQVLEVKLDEDIYAERISYKNSIYNYYADQTQETKLKNQFKEELLLFVPELQNIFQKMKLSLSQQEKEMVKFFETEEKQQTQQRLEHGHFKSIKETFLSTFVDVNPMKTQMMDVLAYEDRQGSQFTFELVSDQEIKQIQEVLNLLNPIIYLSKHPIQITILKIQGLNQRSDLKDFQKSLLKVQKSCINIINNVVRAIQDIILWITDTQEQLTKENIILEPIPERQTIIREMGCIDFCIKILYELHINGLLSTKQEAFDDETTKQEVNALIDVLSTFLQIICKNNYENSLYTFQWYLLYKNILLQGQLNNYLRLDILMSQLFQQTDINIFFQDEVSELAKETKYQKYNKHAYNLLIAFCLHTEFRKKDGIEELINHIFIQNRDTIFAQYKYDGLVQLQMSSKLIDIHDQPNVSPRSSLLDAGNFTNRQALSDYMLSCVKLVNEIARSSHALSLPHIKKIFPFEICVDIIQDPQISSITKLNFLELFQNSYISKHTCRLPNIDHPYKIKIFEKEITKYCFGFMKQSQIKVHLPIVTHPKIKDFYTKSKKKYLLSQNKSIDYLDLTQSYIYKLWQYKTIFELKIADHQFIKLLLDVFIKLLQKGVFIEYFSNSMNFYNSYHLFVEFLRQSIIQISIEQQFLKNQIQINASTSNQSQKQVAQNNEHQKLNRKSKQDTQGIIIWIHSLFLILIQFEQIHQSFIINQFIQDKESEKTIMEIQSSSNRINYIESQKSVQEIIINKNKTFNYSLQNKSILQQSLLLQNQSKKDIQQDFNLSIINYAQKIQFNDNTFVYQLIELLQVNSSKLSSGIIELLFLIFQQKSNFEANINNQILINQIEDHKNTYQYQLVTDLYGIYWKILFAIQDFIDSPEKNSQKYFDYMNDAMSDLLVILYADYSAKSDMQLFMDISQLENEERHFIAHDIKQVQNKNKQQEDNREQYLFSNPDQQIEQKEDILDNVLSQEKEYVEQQNQWKINNSVSFDIQTIFKKQRLLNILNFHPLVKRLVQILIKETKGSLFRDKEMNFSIGKQKGWEIKSEILEKSILFLIYFLIRNTKNQEEIIYESLIKNSYIHEIVNVQRKQLQSYVYIFYSELFRNNYKFLFSLEKFNQEESFLIKLFNKFGNDLKIKNYISCIYFIQFLEVLIKVKNTYIVQNYIIIVQLFKKAKQLQEFSTDLWNLIQKIQNIRIEENIQHQNRKYDRFQRSDHFDGLEIPQEIILFQLILNFFGQVLSVRSTQIDKFIQQMFPLNKLISLLQNLDDWYTLKYQILIFIRNVYLNNLNQIQGEDQNSIKIFVTVNIQKEINIILDNFSKHQGLKFQNKQILNIFDEKSIFSQSNFMIDIDCDKALYNYCIFGLCDICANYSKKVQPQLFNDDKEYMDKQQKLDFYFSSSQVFDNISNLRDQLTLKNSNQNRLKQSNIHKKKSNRNRNIMLTQKLLSANQDDANENSIELAIENTDSTLIIQRIVDIVQSLQQSHLVQGTIPSYNQSQQSMLNKWEETNFILEQQIVDQNIIQEQKEKDINGFINILITLKKDDSQKFVQVLNSFVQLLSDEQTDSQIKLQSIAIIRKLSNLQDEEIGQFILQDLSKLGFTDFLCDLIRVEQDASQKIEYLKALVEYLDDSARDIQQSFLNFLKQDNNQFLTNIVQFISDTFNSVKVYELSSNNQNQQIDSIIRFKINICIYGFELFKQGCISHYFDIQNFLRQQPFAQQVNIIQFSAQTFESYYEIMSEDNAPLGQKIIEFLIQSIQGPCPQNQLELCHQTNILEIIETIIMDQRIETTQSFRRSDIIFSQLRNMFFILQLSLMEGNSDSQIAQKISQYFNPLVIIDRLEIVYWKILKKMKNTRQQVLMEKSKLQNMNQIKKQNNYGVVVEKQFNFKKQKQKQTINDVVKINNLTQQDIENIIEESFSMYLLFRKLSEFLPDFAQFLDEKSTKLRHALTYYKKKTASIEIINMQGQMEKIYFRIPYLMFYLTDQTKKEFLESVGRESLNDKINGLLENVEKFEMEMIHFMDLSGRWIKYNDNLVMFIRKLCLGLVNLIQLIFLTTDSGFDAIQVIGVILLILYCLISLIWFIFKTSLEFNKINKEIQNYLRLKYLYQGKVLYFTISIKIEQIVLLIKKMIFESYTFYWFLFIVICLLGLLYNQMFFSFLLLDIIDHSQILRNVFKSITMNYKQLIMSGLLGLLVMYLYAQIAYLSNNFGGKLESDNQYHIDSLDELDNQVCFSLFECLTLMLHKGFLAGGGIGDFLAYPFTNSDKQYYTDRVIFDISFFIIIKVIGQNLIFGIIIDTFAALRDIKDQKDFDQLNRCFMCNLSRSLFEKEGLSFDKHVQKYHNIWNYLAYIIHLRTKDKIQLSGIESYVQNKINKSDISWLPLEKALDLEKLMH